MNKVITKLVIVLAAATMPVLAQAGNGDHKFRQGHQQQFSHHDGQARYAGPGHHQERRDERRQGYGDRMSRHAVPSHGFRNNSHDARPGHGRNQSVDRRQQWQHERIERGVRSGELTPRETRRLAGEQRAIRQQERIYKTDGVVTRDERRDLQRDLNAAYRHIAVETHDAERRF